MRRGGLRGLAALLFATVCAGPAVAGPTAAGPAGTWRAESIGGAGAAASVRSILEIGPDGTVGGTGGCNRMAGKARISGGTISFGRVVSTQMACDPAAMAQEQKIFEALEAARGWRIDPTGARLTLLDGAGKPIAVFVKG